MVLVASIGDEDREEASEAVARVLTAKGLVFNISDGSAVHAVMVVSSQAEAARRAIVEAPELRNRAIKLFSN